MTLFAFRTKVLHLAMVASLCGPLVAQRSPASRELSGTVTDRRHKPLAAATVQLEEESTEAVRTFVTDADGHYNFKRLGTDIDYRVFATYQGHRSKRHEISRFNSKPNLVVRLIVQP